MLRSLYARERGGEVSRQLVEQHRGKSVLKVRRGKKGEKEQEESEKAVKAGVGGVRRADGEGLRHF